MTTRALRSLSRVDFWQRLAQLNIGLMLLGLGIAVMLEADIGNGPWTVFHQGAALITGLSIGRMMQIAGLVVLGLSVLLARTRPGLGTVLNMLLVGPWVDLFRSLGAFPRATEWWWGVPQFVLGTALAGLATGLYITARLGEGPRDGFVLGLARVLHVGVRTARTGLEALVLLSGWLMGGSVGLGTIIFALGIGPLMQFFLRRFEPGYGGRGRSRA